MLVMARSYTPPAPATIVTAPTHKAAYEMFNVSIKASLNAHTKRVLIFHTSLFLLLHLPCLFWTHSSYCCVSVAALSCSCRLSRAAVATKSCSSSLSSSVQWCKIFFFFLLLRHCWPILICIFQRGDAGGLHASGSDIVSHITAWLR